MDDRNSAGRETEMKDAGKDRIPKTRPYVRALEGLSDGLSVIPAH